MATVSSEIRSQCWIFGPRCLVTPCARNIVHLVMFEYGFIIENPSLEQKSCNLSLFKSGFSSTSHWTLMFYRGILTFHMQSETYYFTSCFTLSVWSTERVKQLIHCAKCERCTTEVVLGLSLALSSNGQMLIITHSLLWDVGPMRWHTRVASLTGNSDSVWVRQGRSKPSHALKPSLVCVFEHV